MSAEIRELVTDDVGHIRFQNMHNENSMTVPSQRLKMQRLRTEEWAARLYEGYCEIWQTQRMPISAEFLRGIVQNAISVLCSARIGAVTDEFVREQHRTGSDANWLKPALEAFKRDLQMLEHNWSQTAELDARTVQYMLLGAPESIARKIAAREVITCRARGRTLEAMIASIEARIAMAEQALNGMLMANTPPYQKSSIEQSLARLKEQRRELKASLDQWELRLKMALRDAEEIDANLRLNLTPQPGERVEGKFAMQVQAEGEQDGCGPSVRETPDGRSEQKIEPQLIYKSVLKRGIMAVLLRKPKASDMDICHDLDLDGAPLPGAWKAGEIRFFESAYRDQHLRPRIQAAISKVRADLRRNRVIP